MSTTTLTAPIRLNTAGVRTRSSLRRGRYTRQEQRAGTYSYRRPEAESHARGASGLTPCGPSPLVDARRLPCGL
jgi:hypothetical protein